METGSLTQLQLQLIFSPTWLPPNTQTPNADNKKILQLLPKRTLKQVRWQIPLIQSRERREVLHTLGFKTPVLPASCGWEHTLLWNPAEDLKRATGHCGILCKSPKKASNICLEGLRLCSNPICLLKEKVSFLDHLFHLHLPHCTDTARMWQLLFLQLWWTGNLLLSSRVAGGGKSPFSPPRNGHRGPSGRKEQLSAPQSLKWQRLFCSLCPDRLWKCKTENQAHALVRRITYLLKF